MRKLLLFFAMLCVSVGTWAQTTYRFGTNNTGTVTISADGKSAVIHCDPDHTFNTAAQEVYAAMTDVESVTFDASSVITGTDLIPLRNLQNVKKLNLSGVKIGNTSNFYVGNFPALEELVMSGIESDGKPIEIAHNYALKKVVVTPVDDTNVTFNTNSSLKGIIKNENVTTTATFQWEGNYSTFSTIEPVNYTAPAAYVHGKTALKITGTMSEDEVANLDVLADASGEIRLLDMSEVTLSGTVSDYVFPFAGNQNLVSVILPKGLPDAKAEWFAGCTNLYSAITYDAGVTEMKAYINKPGSLRNTMMDFGNEDAYEGGGGFYQQSGSDLGNQSLYDGNAGTDLASTITKVKISGKFNNNDIGADNAHYDVNGHIAFNYDNVEYYSDLTAATGGAQGRGALHMTGGSNITTLDLTDAIPEIPTDLRLAAHAANFKNLTTLRLPTDASVTEIPRDCFNASDLSNIKTLCIPMNFEVIGARAFAALTSLRHVYTTGTDETVVYDNGAVTKAVVKEDGSLDETIYKGEEVVGKNVLYGTITLSSNIKKIESYAFYGQTNIKDVYVLATTAPECHVDAFSTVAYVANDAYDTSDVTTKGIITREAYRNGLSIDENTKEVKDYVKWMAILHYPRECTTPDIQRYTDVTRDYSVATGMRDGKGATLYFPNQSEYYRAYLQGTFGYVWDAWDTTRSTDGNNAVTSPSLSKTKGHSQTGGQQAANDLYIANKDAAKTDRAFYDVTLGDDNTSTLSKPAGLQDYWTVNWSQGGTSYQLYPQPATEVIVDGEGNPVMEIVPERDENGNIKYTELPLGSSYEGNYTKATEQQFVEASDGAYCHPLNRNDDNGQWTLGYEYKEDPEGEWVDNPYYSGHNDWKPYSEYSYIEGIKRYKKVLSGLIPFTDQWGSPRFNIGTDYVEYASYNNEYKDILTRYTVKNVDVYSPAQSGDPEPYYKMLTQEVPAQKVTKQNDYRGWHQFVLTAYAHNSTVDIRPYRSYITDSEWWTICMPFDLTKSEVELLYGGNGLPYVSKLTHVIRDIKNERITLMFSNNLMEYKETVASGKVHGVISTTKGGVDDDDVVIHKGVPYLIRPNLKDDAERQFDFRPGERLHAKLKEEAELTGAEQKARIYAGEYTVPAFVINDEDGLEGVESDAVDFTMGDGTIINYTPGTIKYFGENVPYKISSETTYTFVGSYYKSLMPVNCYFLGWDARLNGGKGGAAFWYNKNTDETEWNWNNETGIIIPNFNKLSSTSTTIHDATGSKDPARWIITGTKGDDIKTPAGGNGAKKYSMLFGNDIVDESGEATGINEMSVTETGENSIYNLKGEKVGSSMRSLPKGVYIKNGNKYVVK